MGERYYEDSPAYDATIEDIDMDAVRAYVKRVGYGKSPMEYLQENKGHGILYGLFHYESHRLG